MSPKRVAPDWQNITDEDLLRFRIRDMGLQISGTALESRVARDCEVLASLDVLRNFNAAYSSQQTTLQVHQPLFQF